LVKGIDEEGDAEGGSKNPFFGRLLLPYFPLSPTCSIVKSSQWRKREKKLVFCIFGYAAEEFFESPQKGR